MTQETDSIPTVLIIEDDPVWMRLYARSFRPFAAHDGLRLILASTIDEGWMAFTGSSDLALIVLDGNVPIRDVAALPQDVRSMVDLAREIRKTYPGPMVAASSEEAANRQLLAMGCDRSVPDKKDAAKFALELLGLGS